MSVIDLKPRAATVDTLQIEAPEPAGTRNMRGLLEDAERREITNALEQSNWIVAGPNGAAARLGMKRSTLQSRMQKLGIRVSRTGSA